jgi:hypothetical protein
VEYAVLLGTVTAVIVGMQVYAKRAMQGRLKQGVDMIAERAGNLAQGRQARGESQGKLEPEPGEAGSQFSPRWSRFSVTGTSHARARATLTQDGEQVSTLLDHAVSKRGWLDDFSDKRMNEEGLFE